MASLATFAVACSDDSASDTTGGAAASSVAPAPGDSGAGTTVALDPATALQQGLAALSAGYHFTSSVTVNGAQTLVADGDRVGDASRLTITSNNATLSYVITSTGNYVKPGDGDWERLDVPPATTDPLTALAAASAVTALPPTDGYVQVRVTVPATALGIAADGAVDVDVTLQNGSIVQVTYTAAVEGGNATVITQIGPITDPTPITPPI